MRKLLIIGLVLSGLVFTGSLFAAEMVTEEWVARYGGPANNAYDVAEAITLHASGNIYVTGYSYGSGTNYDYATVKYDPAGGLVWVRRYNGPANGTDYASAIAIDSSGNVYVTGQSQSYGGGTNYDYATVKYDTNGNQQWLARYNGPGNSYDRTYAIAIDSLDNVYVTGTSVGGTHVDQTDYATIKYDAYGNQQWVARYNGPGNSKDVADAMTIDSGGNVYVTGISFSSGTKYDYVTVKYDTNGKQQWVATYNGPGNSYDYANAISVDSQDNVYVTGLSYGSGTNYDFATVKYDTAANELWVKRYNNAALNSRDSATAIAIDSADNVYVTGYSAGGGTYSDYATVKYNSDGVFQWVARYNGPLSSDDTAEAIALDASGSVYVTGYSYGDGTWRDYATVKYDPAGNEIWVQRYNGPVDDHDMSHAIAVDLSGNVYVTGQSYGSGTNYDYVTIKYAQPLPTEAIKSLIAYVISLNLKQGIENSLDAKLDNALRALEAANAGLRHDAANKILAFINEVEAQRGKALTNEQADTLLENASDILLMLS